MTTASKDIRPPELSAPDHEVAVIGAGPGGIAAGVKLKRARVRDFVLLERADQVGGSWHENHYPGLEVDIPSLAYQYSFARNPNWSRLFASGAEVKRYHMAVARRFGLYPHIRFGTTVVSEEWDEDRHRWMLHLDTGEVTTARFVISAVGAFISPKTDPGIPGLTLYQGTIQRPSDWDDDYDLTGKRVAIIGTGASPVQITPSIADAVGSLVGPYSWTGSGWHAFVEMTADHAVRAISEARRRGATFVAIRQDVHDAYHRRVYRRGAAMRYYLAELNAHVPTYYRNSQGDSSYIRPTGFFSAQRAHRHFPFADYEFERLPA